MPECGPIAGKRILITRSRKQALELTRRLEALGAEVSLLPMVSFAEPEDTRELDECVARLPEFDWLIFTSGNAVRFFAARCRALGVAPGLQKRPRVAAVGPATAAAAEESGWKVWRVADTHSGEGLARELRAEVHGRRVLLPRSDCAGNAMTDALREAGADVQSVVAYRTLAPEKADAEVLARVRRKEIDVIVFASPSAVHNFTELYAEQAGSSPHASALADLGGDALFAAIGPTTATALRETGLPVAIEAREATPESLAAAIRDYFEARAECRTRQEA